MSIGSFSASLSGLNANQQKLSVIGNNLANLNTVAFKASTVDFADLVSQSVGGPSSNPMQIGLGVTTGQITPNFSQGSVENTGIATNVAIQGAGFFVIGDLQSRAYSRAGNFGFNADGMLVTADGLPVQGYTKIDPATGQIDTSGPPTDIVVPPGVLRAPAATTMFSTISNLDAAAATGATFTASVQLYDSLGVPHVATIAFAKTAPGAWTYTVTVPGAEVTGGTAGTPFQIGTGTLGFSNLGKLTTVNGGAAADVTITSPTWANGAAPVNFTWDLVDGNGVSSLTGYAAASSTSSITQNGSPSAAPSSIIVIDQDGQLKASFGVGQTLTVGVLSLATFNNPQGLVKLGTNLFSESEASGLASIGTAGTGSRGTLIGSSLEQSNVDIAHEFTQMILAQRGYQASSKGITVADELLVDTLNLKR
jgi:flagellar hook protein FlgE